MKKEGLIVLLCTFFSCGYRFGDGESLARQYQTISVPYVQGDRDGRLTNTLIRSIPRVGNWHYRSCGADLMLIAEVVCCDHRYIGYQRDRVRCLDALGNPIGPPLGTEVARLLPNEGRMGVELELCLIERRSGATLYGPVRVYQEMEYDYDPVITDNRLAVFSLGEFVNEDQASDIVRSPLCEALAEKIIDLLSCVCI